MTEKLEEILSSFKGEKEELISILQSVQERKGFLSKEAISEIARFLNMSKSEVFGVASFYAQFRFTHPAKHNIKICLGTACHVRGGEAILETVKRELGVQGDASKDNKFRVERVACFGCCALAPVMVVNNTVYGRMTPVKAKKILGKK